MNAELYRQSLKDLHRIGLWCKGYFHCNDEDNYKMYIIITKRYKRNSVRVLYWLTGNGLAEIYSDYILRNPGFHVRNVLSQSSYMLKHTIQIFKPFKVYDNDLDHVKDLYLHITTSEPFREKQVVWYSARIVCKYEYVLIEIER